MKEIISWWTNEKDCPYTEIKRFDWFVVIMLVAVHCCGADKVIAGVILILKPMPKMELLLTGHPL